MQIQVCTFDNSDNRIFKNLKSPPKNFEKIFYYDL